jgi:membrane fusion protein (multidrug efflux system)
VAWFINYLDTGDDMTFLHRGLPALGAAFLALGLGACTEPEAPAPPQLEIAVVEVLQRDQPITLEMVGETRGSVDIPIRARVDGFLEGIHFTEGRKVEKGQLLYTIDPLPFEARVAEAQGYVAEATTMVAKARSDLARIRPLAEMRAVSEQDLDSAVAQFEAAKGSLTAAEAQQKQTEYELGYTNIHAPVGGRVGITEVRVGEYVGTGTSSLLNFVSKIDPIRVRFSIDERNYLQMARRVSAGDIVKKEDRSELELILADGTLHPYGGKMVATDAAINPQTGTFTLEADFSNPEGIVIAGQFARVRAVIGLREGALLVPQRAVSELQGTFRVFVVDGQGKVAMRDVELGPRIDRFTIVESGLEPGESIAIEGLLRLQDGMTITAKPTKLDEVGNIVGAGGAAADTGGA